MKTQEELNALKEEVEALNKKLANLNEKELNQVFGGQTEEEVKVCPRCGEQYTGEHSCRRRIKK